MIMTDKILFWIDLGLIQFGIAKFLQKKYRCEMYAIYDLNPNLKKSFKNQNLVNFKKEWYFWDFVSKDNSEPDLNYLKKFEKKYHINLWKLAYGERVFNEYNPYYQFKGKQILKILEQECKFFESVINEITPHYLIIRTTDFHRLILLEKLSRAKGITVLMLVESKLGYRCSISPTHDGIEFSKLEKDFNDTSYHSLDLKQYLQKYNKNEQVNRSIQGMLALANISFKEKIKLTFIWMTKTFNEEYKKLYIHYGLSRKKVLFTEFFSLLKTKLRSNFINNNFIYEIPPGEKFIYFPLQIQPERNVDVDAPYYTDQIEVVYHIAKSLPAEYLLYVKEHPHMIRRNWRKISDYKKILKMSNVRLIHPKLNSKELLRKCSLVITIAGTSGLEAAFEQKPSIVFSDVIYSILPSVYRLRRIEDLPQAIQTSLKKQVSLSDVSKLVSIIDKNSFEFDIRGLYDDISYRFCNNAFLVTDNILMNDLDLFFSEHKSEFEKLVDEHIKKIEKAKNYNKIKKIN